MNEEQTELTLPLADVEHSVRMTEKIQSDIDEHHYFFQYIIIQQLVN